MPRLEPGEFSVFPHKLAQFLSPLNQAVLFWLWKYSDNKTGKCWPSVKTLAVNCCTSKNSIRKALKELEELDRIEKKTRKGNHAAHNKTNLYTVKVVQNLKYPGSNSEVGGSNSEGRTKYTELNSKELNPLCRSSNDDLLQILFSASSFTVLEKEATKLVKSYTTRSWKQELCAVFDNKKTIDEIWSLSVAFSEIQAHVPNTELPRQKHALNTIDAILREGHSYETIVETLKDGWWELEYEFFNGVLV